MEESLEKASLDCRAPAALLRIIIIIESLVSSSSSPSQSVRQRTTNHPPKSINHCVAVRERTDGVHLMGIRCLFLIVIIWYQMRQPPDTLIFNATNPCVGLDWDLFIYSLISKSPNSILLASNQSSSRGHGRKGIVAPMSLYLNDDDC